jgi:hypothetical protein
MGQGSLPQARNQVGEVCDLHLVSLLFTKASPRKSVGGSESSFLSFGAFHFIPIFWLKLLHITTSLFGPSRESTSGFTWHACTQTHTLLLPECSKCPLAHARAVLWAWLYPNISLQIESPSSSKSSECNEAGENLTDYSLCNLHTEVRKAGLRNSFQTGKTAGKWKQQHQAPKQIGDMGSAQAEMSFETPRLLGGAHWQKEPSYRNWNCPQNSRLPGAQKVTLFGNESLQM